MTVDPTELIGILYRVKIIPKMIDHNGRNVTIFFKATLISPSKISIKMKLKITKTIEVEQSQNTALTIPALPKIPCVIG